MKIRTMRRKEISLAIDWAAREGWNPGIEDHAAFAAADPGGFLIGTINEQPAAVISAVRYGAGFGFIGCYIVAPELRGHGYGWKIWQTAMQQLAGRNVGLDGVIAQQDNYKRSGFVLAHANIRYAGNASAATVSLPDRVELKPLSSLPMDRISDYDSRFFPDDRRLFLGEWLTQPQSYGLVATECGMIVGYGLIRPCQQGFKLAPLFADRPAIAEALLVALGNNVPTGSELYLDVPAVNPDGVALAKEFHMQPVFETARMYTCGMPEIAIKHTYGITSFELG